MTEYAYTRCPGCTTVFRVTPAQLALREGQVRCGHCRAVFDANDHGIAVDAQRSDGIEGPDELAAGRPTVTLRSADALQPVDAPSAEIAALEPATPAAEVPAVAPPDDVADTPDAVADVPTDVVEPPTDDVEPPTDVVQPPNDVVEAAASNEAREVSRAIDIGTLDRAGRFEWKPKKPLRERPKALYVIAAALLLAALAVQAVAEYRDALAAHVPSMRPLLQAACDLADCTVGPLRDAAALSIDASDLQADPAHRGLLQLTATIRNRAAYAIAWPLLELTLTDASDRIVARRAFSPAEYAGEAANPTAGIAGNGEKLVTLVLDASATSQAGYRLYLFYP